MTTPPAPRPDRALSYSVDGREFSARPLAPGLYIVATPIGNLGDITLRALATLAAADLIACEDTRVSSVLTRHFGISAPLIPYHDHNATRQRPKLLAALAADKAVALISDAGTPLVSDPGYRLVVDAIAAGHAVVPIPGASSLLSALMVAGLPTDAFFFAGFLPPKEVARRKRLAALKAIPATLVFFESPQRLKATLPDMVETLGDRPAAVARELTKAFETLRRGTLAGLAGEFAEAPPPKGEIVIVVGPPLVEAIAVADVDRLIASLLHDHSISEAAAEAAAVTGLPRRDLYRRALALRGDDDRAD
jgi:16S rRNA (cytidine1402-2'-O)-methyltransferase